MSVQYLKHGIEKGANSAAGWKALAELQYQNRQFQEAYDTAVDGLEWSVKRRRAGHETLTSFALALRLVVAQCLRRLERLDEAEYNFQVLAGECCFLPCLGVWSNELASSALAWRLNTAR